MKTILFFGIYDRTYARTVVLRNGFERNGWRVEECHLDARANKGLSKYWKLARMGLRARREKHDLVLVGFPGHTVVWLARLLFGPKIIFDAFLSIYDANVFDRKIYSKNSWRAKKDRLLDLWSCKLAERVLLDTNAHIDFFVKTFGIPREKFLRVLIGADDTVFTPSHAQEDSIFTIHFHGTFIPVQGVDYIVEAARLLRDTDVRFRIIGSGQEAVRVDRMIQEYNFGNVIERISKIPVTQVPGYLARAHVTLGLLGDRERIQRAIPNKVYEAMAMGKATITADTIAIRELPDVEQALVLVPPADPRALADAILVLRSNRERRLALGKAARELFEKECLPEKVVADLLVALGA
jgi:glycosyltransferase involved in cell wall biosynthesis